MIEILIATALPFTLNYDQLETDLSEPVTKVLTINKQGRDLVKHFEGLFLRPYLCPSGKLTIGYGHTGSAARRKRFISIPEAETLLNNDLNTFEKVVRDSVTVPLTTSQFSALVSFSFNVGEGAFRRSSLRKHLNNGDYSKASNEFPKWVRDNRKRVLKGLVLRRKAEQELFNSDS